MPGFRVKRDVDHGFEAFFWNLGVIGERRVKVGIQGREAVTEHEGRPTGGSSRSGGQVLRGKTLTTVELATIHEFGAPGANIPQRSFLRSTADENRSKYARRMERMVRKFVRNPEGFSILGEMTKLGEAVRRDVINKIRSNIPPPLKPATVRRKRGDELALVDTGQLVNSIRAVVV